MIQSLHHPRVPARSAVLAARHSVCLHALLLLALLVSSASAATVRAYLQPDHAHTGEAVAYVITVQNGTVQNSPQLRLPAQVRAGVGQSASHTIDGGTLSSRLEWGIVGTEPGEFVIPPQEILVNGEILKTNEVRLTVTEAPVTAPAPEEDANIPLFQIEVGKTEIYQGEVVPISASLFVPRGTVMIRRVGLIEVSKNDFAVARFPQQSEETATVINGVGYGVLTYRSTLSALHAGDLKVGPATSELLFEVYDADTQRQMRGRMIPNLPFGMVLGAPEVRKHVVKSQDVKIKVLPLPTEGKPANFSGAVGDFSISATASPNELAVGDPLAVDITIDGSGNFEALSPPTLMPPDGWKAYPARRYNVDGPIDPNLTPTLQRRIGYSMVFVPEKVHTELPAFELSYFSPTQKKYIAARTPPIALRIKPGAVTAAAAVADGSGGTEPPKPPPVLQPKPQISDILMNVPARARWLNTTAVSAPLTTSARFWAIQTIPAALVIVAALFAWFRRRHEESTRGLRGELQLLWRGLEETSLTDRDFLQRAAHFIHRSQPGEIQDAELKQIVHRYETQSFTATPAPEQALGPAERSRILSRLAPLLKQAVLFIALFSTLSLTAAEPEASPDEIYRQAREALEKGKFTQAQSLGESLVRQQPPALSSAVFTIIANARYKQDDLGSAAMWYQRAQLLDPMNAEVRQNLRHLDEKLRFFRFGESSPLAQTSLLLSKNTWIILASAGVWLILLAVVRCILASSRKTKTSGGITALIFSLLGLFLLIPSVTFASIRPLPGDRVKDVMVVIPRDVRAYTAATLTSGSVIDSIPPGSQIRLLEKRGAWSYVEIPTSDEHVRGWVESAKYMPLWPWDMLLVP